MSDPAFGDLLLIGSPESRLDLIISRNGDWYDELPPITVDGVALPLAGKGMEMSIRPTFGFPSEMLHLAAGNGLFYAPDVVGGVTISVPKATIIAQLPVGQWTQTMRLYDPARTYGWFEHVLWRGALIVTP